MTVLIVIVIDQKRILIEYTERNIFVEGRKISIIDRFSYPKWH